MEKVTEAKEQTAEKAKNRKTTFVIILVAVVAGVLFSGVLGGGDSSSASNNGGTTAVDDGRVVQPNEWYHYKPLNIVNFQNCVVTDAFVRDHASSGGVFVNYYPVCAQCGETGDVLGVAIVSEEESYMKRHYCDCGANTSVIIKVKM